MEKPRILIIEDEKRLARFLELELVHEGYEVEIAGDGREGLEMLEKGGYDLVLLDIMLPGLSGIEVCRRLRQFSFVPVIMVTARDDVTDRVMGLDMGADDYITKPFAIEELLARIRAVMRRHQEIQTEVLKVEDLFLNSGTRQVKRGKKEVELSRREFDLLYYLMKNRNLVLTREQILREVWGYDYTGDTNVVDVYIRYLRAKMDDPWPNKLIRTVRGVGYTLRESSHED